MISWLQNALQKHHRIIFGVLLVIIIISFVFTIGSVPRGTQERGVGSRKFYGVDLHSQREMDRELTATGLSLQLQGRAPRTEQGLEQAALHRIVLAHLADEMKVPEPTDKQLEEYIKGLPAFQGRGGFDQTAYTRFADRYDASPSGRIVPFGTVMAEDWRHEQVRKALAGPGYVVPFEAEQELQFGNAKWSITLATLNIDTFNPAIPLEDAKLKEFYEQNKPAYEQPARYHVSYVVFPADKYPAPSGEPSEAELRAFFQSNQALFNPPQTDAKAERKVRTFEEARQDVVVQFRRAQQRRLAAKAADSFAYELFDKHVKRSGDAFANLVKQSGGELKALPPFGRDQLPQNTGLSAQVLGQAFHLTAEKYYSDALLVDDGAVVLVLDRLQPSAVPPFEEIRKKVVADYLMREKERLFAARGEELKKTLSEAVEQGKNFEETAKAAGLTVESHKDFTLNNPPAKMSPTVIMALNQQAKGKVSPMITVGENGYFVLVTDKVVEPVAPENPELKMMTGQLANYTAMLTAQQVLESLTQKELARTERKP